MYIVSTEYLYNAYSEAQKIMFELTEFFLHWKHENYGEDTKPGQT